MSGPFTRLRGDDLRSLALALRTGRLVTPYAPSAVRRLLSSHDVEAVAAGLLGLEEDGWTPAHLARMFEIMADDRASRSDAGELIELVWTGPESEGVANRDTGVVVRELFTEARSSVMIAGYAIHQGHFIFRSLAERMDSDPDLKVRMYLNIRRGGDVSAAAPVVMARFARDFVDRTWPGRRLPEIYCDPRSLDLDASRRSSLHAKCIVINSGKSLVSSANFTEAAQLRNIEVGVLIHSRSFADRLTQHFETLVAGGALHPVVLPDR